MIPSNGTKVLFKTSISTPVTFYMHDQKIGEIKAYLSEYSFPTFEIAFDDGSFVQAVGEELFDPHSGEWLWEGEKITIGEDGRFKAVITKP